MGMAETRQHMTRTWRDPLSRLATVEPIAVTEGEPGVALPGGVAPLSLT